MSPAMQYLLAVFGMIVVVGSTMLFGCWLDRCIGRILSDDFPNEYEDEHETHPGI